MTTVPSDLKQDIFDKIATHLLTQNAKAVEVVGNVEKCRYRTTDGKQCAVGCLMSKEDYDPEFEDKCVSHLVYISNWIPDICGARFVRDQGEELVQYLDFFRKIHDDNPPEIWLFCLEQLAYYLNLSKTVLEKFQQE